MELTSGDSDSLSAHAHGEDLGGVRPRNRAHSDGETADEEVGEDDDCLRDTVMVTDDPDTVAVNRAPMSIATLKTTDEHEPEAHKERAGEEHRAATPLVNIDDGRDREHDVEHVLNRVRDEVATAAGKASALEDVDDVVHHDVHARQLRPHLERRAERDTAEDTRLKEVEVGLGAFGALKADLLLDFVDLELHEFVVRVTLAVQVGEDLERLVLTRFSGPV